MGGLLAGLTCAWPSSPAVAQTAGDPGLDGLTGEQLFSAACANCHGVDGTGAPAEKVAFEEALPDFTDCSFASREPSADWVAVAHQGGPLRGFSRMMPAFGEALSVEQLERIIGYVRGFCGDASWPPGELNLPRAFLTEKAYPEDEAVLTTSVGLEGDGSVMNELVYEKRIGARSQYEVVVPFGFRERSRETGGAGWVGGIGDLVLGLKRDVYHDAAGGSILALGAEAKIPTGDDVEGFGAGTPVFESFLSFGQALPSNGFLQLQGVVEVPADEARAEKEAAWRGVFGRTVTQGPFGRAWSPMIEIQGKKELEGGTSVEWDLMPQLQVSLNRRQHVMASVGVLLPLTQRDVRSSVLYAYLLWDWFDGGLLEGW